METFSDPIKEFVYKLLSTYYDDMTLVKIRDENDFSIYMARLQCLLLNEQRYIIAMVPKDHFPPYYQQKLSGLRWVSLQIRNLDDMVDLMPQSYSLKRDPKFERKLKIVSRNNHISVYDVENLPIKVSLLHTKNNVYEYPEQGTLISALETFRTIINFNKY